MQEPSDDVVPRTASTYSVLGEDVDVTVAWRDAPPNYEEAGQYPNVDESGTAAAAVATAYDSDDPPPSYSTNPPTPCSTEPPTPAHAVEDV